MFSQRAGTGALCDHQCPAPTLPLLAVASTEEKKGFTAALVNLVAAKLLPPSIVEDTFLHTLLQTCIDIGANCGKVKIETLVMDHKTLTSALKKTADRAREELVAQIGEIVNDGLASATVDGWKESKTSRKYLAHTASLITEDFVMHDHALCTPHIDAEHITGDVLREVIKESKKTLGLSEDAKLHYVCDDGSDIVAALNNEDRSYCMDHCTSLCVKKPFEAKLSKTDLYGEGPAGHLIDTLTKCVDIIKKSRAPKYRVLRGALVKGPTNRPSPTESQRIFRSSLPMLRSVRRNFKQVQACLTEIGHGEELRDITATNIAQTDILVSAIEAIGRKHDNSFIGDDYDEIAALTAPKARDSLLQTSLKEHLKATVLALCRVLQVVKKCKEDVGYMKSSGLNAKVKGGTLRQEVDTRWLSHLHLLRSFFVDTKLHPTLTRDSKIIQVNDILRERNKTEMVLSEGDKQIMSDMIPLLTFFEKAVKAFEAEKYPTIQHVIPQFK
ncbi:hypothetical protein FOCC_FOCC014459, partial [Frankliniella occidentalis]